MTSFRKGERVSHARFGPGVVIEVDVRYAIIEFDDGGARKFLTTLVQLESCGLPPPVRPAPVRRKRRRTTARDPVAAPDATQSEVGEPETPRPLR